MKQILWIIIITLTVLLINSCGTNQGETLKTPEKIEFPTVNYTINPSVDTTIFGPQGTRIFIGSETFQFEDGSIATDSITINLKEFYNKTDIILADLSTVSGNRLLETAGMVHIDASSNGQKLEINKDKRIVVHLPKDQNEYKRMNLFYADQTATDTSVSNWEVDTVNLIKKTMKLGGHGYRWVSHNDSTEFEWVPKNYIDTGYYWNPMDFYVYSRDFSESTMNEIESVSDFMGVECQMTIGKNGRIKNEKINSKISASAKKELLIFLRNLPELEPGKNNKGEIIDRIGFLHIEGGNIIPLYKSNKEYIESFDSKYSKYEKEPIRNMNDAELNYYVFSVSKLGWINCDRFIDTEETTNMFAQTPVDANTKLKMVFSDIDGVLKADIVEGKYVFSKVPKGKQVTIIGIKNENGQFLTAFKEITITDKPIDVLTFTETTLESLREKLEKI